MNLIGASGHAKVIIDILKSQGIEVEALYDENENIKEMLGKQVLHHHNFASPLIISIGNNKIRKRIAESLNLEYGTAIHTSSIVSSYAIVGMGSVVMQGSIIQSCAKVGKHCIINTGATVDHDCELQDYVHISPNSTLCGNVFVGEGTHIGAGTVILQGVKIGKWCVIGAGSVVTKDIPDYILAVGNRCKIIKSIDS
jgi:sugar O-acyltransferase (sialic acid O-acetyltransferase NeuD family)